MRYEKIKLPSARRSIERRETCAFRSRKTNYKRRQRATSPIEGVWKQSHRDRKTRVPVAEDQHSIARSREINEAPTTTTTRTNLMAVYTPYPPCHRVLRVANKNVNIPITRVRAGYTPYIGCPRPRDEGEMNVPEIRAYMRPVPTAYYSFPGTFRFSPRSARATLGSYRVEVSQRGLTII